MTPAAKLATAGFLATAVAFGPARMGFGLFLPAFRADFGLSTSVAGLIASGGFLGFLLALLASAWTARRYGERITVVAGALAALAGFSAVALAVSPAALAIGVGLAGASAGLCWAPFNDAAERVIVSEKRAGALSIVSTGTSFGVIAAACLALLVADGDLPWRGAWAGFALCALVLVGATLFGVPPGQTRGGARSADGAAAGGGGITGFMQPAALPLLCAALCFGMTNTIFLSFAADRVAAAGGLPGLPDQAAATAIFLAYGVFGVTGLFTGWIEKRIGLSPLLCAIFLAGAASLVLIALAPTSWLSVIAGSGLHGVAIMMVSAVFSFWSLRLFPGRGTMGFTVTLLCVAAGSVIGPAVAGFVAAAHGQRAMFLVAAVPPCAAALWFGLARRV